MCSRAAFGPVVLVARYAVEVGGFGSGDVQVVAVKLYP